MNDESNKEASLVERVNKKTVRYADGELSALIWVDYEAGLFKRGRILKASSIEKWENRPDSFFEQIDEYHKKKIIEAVLQYFESKKRSCRLEL